MLALCSMLSGTYYAHNYASIIGGSLMVKLQVKGQGHQICAKSTVEGKYFQSTIKKYLNIITKSQVTAKFQWVKTLTMVADLPTVHTYMTTLATINY